MKTFEDKLHASAHRLMSQDNIQMHVPQNPISPRKAYWGWVATPAAAVAGLVFGMSLHLFMVDRQEVRYVQQTDTVRILHPVHDTLYLTQVVEKERIVVRQVADSDQAESVPIQEGADTSACTSIMCDGINYSILASN